MKRINVPIALVSLLASGGIWFNVWISQSTQPITTVTSVPIQIGNPDETRYMVTNAPDVLSLSFVGTKEQLAELDRKNLVALVTIASPTLGVEKDYPVTLFPREAREFNANSALTAKVLVQEIMQKRVRILPNPSGTPPPGKKLQKIDVFPTEAWIYGSAESVKQVASVSANVDVNGEAAREGGTQLPVRAVDANGKNVPGILTSDSIDRPAYNQTTLSEPFYARFSVIFLDGAVSGD
jgi:YbbR domain-containing protein